MSNNEFSTVVMEYKKLQNFIKELEAEAEALKDKIIDEMESQQTD